MEDNKKLLKRKGRPEDSLVEKIYKIWFILGEILYLVSVIINLYLGLDILTVILPAISAVILIFAYLFFFRKNKVDAALIITIFSNNFLFTPIMWMSNSGLEGGCQYFVFLFATATVIMLRGKVRIVFLIFFTLEVFILSMIDWLYPEIIKYFSQVEALKIDSIISIVISLVSVIFTVGYIMNVYLKEHKKLQEISSIDDLTNQYNRRHAISTLNKMVEKANKEDIEKKFVVFIDVDNFKNINDIYGHEQGDKLLIEICKTINREIRKGDYLARMGGDEFLLILNAYSLDNAKVILKRIIDTIHQQNKVTISAGIVPLKKHGSVKSILSDADKYMYKAKDRGKNTFVTLEEDNI